MIPSTSPNTGIGFCSGNTAIPALDVETYSEAGYIYNQQKERYQSLVKNSPGLKGVGAAVYAEHPSTELLLLSCDLLDGKGVRLWVQGMGDPLWLFSYIRDGGLLESHNAGFEFLIWDRVCRARMDWPSLPLEQQRCSMAKAQRYALPGKLEKLTEVLGSKIKKNPQGSRLIRLFSIPRSPTKYDKRRRIYLTDNPKEAFNFCLYNADDVRSEMEASSKCPDLTPFELEVWLTSQRINMRGVQVDVEALEDCLAIYDQAEKKYTKELFEVTNGTVRTVAEVEKMRDYLNGEGVDVPNIQADTVKDTLTRADLPAHARRVLEIRQLLSMASVKKLHAINVRRCKDNRLRDLFKYCGADRTGRWSGSGVQPQNLASKGPKVDLCHDCDHHQARGLNQCQWCGGGLHLQPVEWSLNAVEDVLTLVKTRNLETVEHVFGNALKALSGCLRALFIAAPGHDFICSDYSAIEAVVLAELAGETWRQEVFRTHGMIYEESAARIFKIPMNEILEHKEKYGGKHPVRDKSKRLELSLGYQGWLGALKAFGGDAFFNDDQEMKEAILKWRADSPNIVEFWGGQWRKNPHAWIFKREFYGLEGAAVCAVLNPGQAYRCRLITYCVINDVLMCQLPSGRFLYYHQPRLTEGVDLYSKQKIYKLSYMGWNSDSTKGPVGWMRMNTYGGKLVENCLSGKTLVFTHRGMIRLNNIRLEDRIWDGYEFVKHGGLINQGVQEVVSWQGLQGTKDHLIKNGNKWNRLIDMDENTIQNVLKTGQDSLVALFSKLMELEKMQSLNSNVIAGQCLNDLHMIYSKKELGNAQNAGIKKQVRKDNLNQLEKCKERYFKNGFTAIQGLFHAAQIKTAKRSKTMVRAALKFLNRGLRTVTNSYCMFKNYQIGIRTDSTLTESTIMETMNLEIFDSLHDPKIVKIEDLQKTQCGSSTKKNKCYFHNFGVNTALNGRDKTLMNILKKDVHQKKYTKDTKIEVFDLKNCGPRNQFMVMTNAGPVIVHNCTQATARDILAHALVEVERAGYRVVLHVHDELVIEVPKNTGSISDIECIMGNMPAWCANWPVKASGGWRGLRYRKD